ncbi:hypothetical protein [Lysobacter rhizosphaerae]
MRELTDSEIENVNGAGFWSDLWDLYTGGSHCPGHQSTYNPFSQPPKQPI